MLAISQIISEGRVPDEEPTSANMCAYHRDGRWYLLESWGDYYCLLEVEPETEAEAASLMHVTRFRHGPSAN